ncbi:60S ribosomal protein L10a [Camellia lanceoleosa]|uniref:60S ribosomal protein L10a n=1 Tax=Camellia lanceoleosa TaxID=1840588 RepID=A0ACC0FIX7_9ERIC|nr:60S ribosomal protein L10a [Camellia lanceoleosa]
MRSFLRGVCCSCLFLLLFVFDMIINHYNQWSMNAAGANSGSMKGKFPTLVTHQEPVESKVNETKATVKFQLMKKDNDAVKEALDQLSEVGWANKWSSKPYVSRCMVNVHNKCEVLGKCYSNISHVYKSMRKCTMVPGVKTGRRKRATSGNILSTSKACPQEIGIPMTFSDETQPPDDTQTVVEETQPGGVVDHLGMNTSTPFYEKKALDHYSSTLINANPQLSSLRA